MGRLPVVLLLLAAGAVAANGETFSTDVSASWKAYLGNNAGWVGGGFGVGKRISIRHTRAMLNAVLEGALGKVKFRQDKIFGFDVPVECPDVPQEILDPAASWSNQDEYWKKYDALGARYIENFKQFADGCPPDVAAAGPKRLA